MSAEEERIEVAAPAKINLRLEILGRRENGYHDIRSVVVPISLCDTVLLRKCRAGVNAAIESGSTGEGFALNGLALNGQAPALPAAEKNLATRAALALREATGYEGGVRIFVRKRIPIGGGLGGGSADAAAVLNGLNALWGTGLSRQDLMRIGARLGSDITALVHGGPILVEGLGEKVTPLRVGRRIAQAGERNDAAEAAVVRDSGWWLVVMNPGFSVSTADIYSRHRLCLTSPEEDTRSMISLLEQGNLDAVAGSLFNSLEQTVIRKFPLIGIIKEALNGAGAAGALLSGSGASVFGLARHREHALEVGESAAARLGWAVWWRVARILPDSVTAAHGPLEA